MASKNIKKKDKKHVSAIGDKGRSTIKKQVAASRKRKMAEELIKFAISRKPS